MSCGKFVLWISISLSFRDGRDEHLTFCVYMRLIWGIVREGYCYCIQHSWPFIHVLSPIIWKVSYDIHISMYIYCISTKVTMTILLSYYTIYKASNVCYIKTPRYNLKTIILIKLLYYIYLLKCILTYKHRMKYL